MDRREGPIDTNSDTGQVERLMECIAFSKALASIYDMETLLTAVLQRLNAIIPARNWSLLLIDPKTGELYFAVVVGVAPEAVKDIRLKPGEGIAGAVVQTGQALFIPDVNTDPRFCQWVDTITGFDTRSIIAQPLLVRGEVIGVFEVINVADERIFREKYFQHLAILADYVAIAVDNVRNLQKLHARTFIDEVTGFYNTRYLIQKLDRLIPRFLDRGDHFSLVFLDLDHFKDVVDQHGHLRGARILAEVAWVIHREMGPDDSIVRYGGDEFIILLPRRSQAEALEITRRLRRALNANAFMENEGLAIHLTASYGIATMPEDAQDRESLLLIADQALFGSKQQGRDRIMLGRDLVPLEENRSSSD
jgi:diguanylate cyclase (GGDEF)-like protein